MFRWIAIFAVAVSSLASAQTLDHALAVAMGRRSGAAVVVSVDPAKILASYHPQALAQRLALPGSAIKPFVLLELLRLGKVLPATEWSCRRDVTIGKHNLDCRHVRTIEAMNAERALAYSCNSYFTEMAARVEGVELSTALRRAGFGAPTHLVRDEATGYVKTSPTRETTQLEAVGEYGIATTPLQMANAFRLLASQAKSQDETVRTVFAGLRGAVAYGTAQGARLGRIDVAGKTGTATAAEGPWTHAWFAGFAPADKPEVVIVIFLERGHGSDAADIAGTVLKAWERQRR